MSSLLSSWNKGVNSKRYLKQTHPKVSHEEIARFAHNQPAYWSVIHSARRRSSYNRIKPIGGPCRYIQMDTMYLLNLKNFNEGYCYLQVVVDVFTRKLYCEPLKSMNSESYLEAFKKNLNKIGLISFISSDLGSEIANRLMTDFFEKYGIKWFVTNTRKFKTSVCERSIRTLRRAIYTYLINNKTKNYINALPQILNRLNAASTRATGRSRNSLSEHFFKDQILKRGKEGKFKKPTYKVGQLVRTSNHKGIFEKESSFHSNFSRDIKLITKFFDKRRIPQYQLTRIGEVKPLRKSFYEYELLPVELPNYNGARAINVIRNDKLGGYVIEYLKVARGKRVIISRMITLQELKKHESSYIE